MPKHINIIQRIPLIRPIYYKYPEMYDDVRYRNEYFR